MNFSLKIPILIINCLTMLWLAVILLGDSIDDFSGLLFVGVILFLIIYNAYAFLVCKVFKKMAITTKLGLFLLLLIFPFLVVLHLTT